MAMPHRAFVNATCAMKTTAKLTHTLGFRVWTVQYGLPRAIQLRFSIQYQIIYTTTHTWSHNLKTCPRMYERGGV